jgi:hypothetical protein
MANKNKIPKFAPLAFFNTALLNENQRWYATINVVMPRRVYHVLHMLFIIDF